MSKICVFFGHRDAYDIPMDLLKNEIRNAIMSGHTEFWYGGYGAFDSAAAKAVREVMKEFPEVSLYKILAYMPKEKAEVDNIIEDAEKTIYPDGLETVPKRLAIVRRNQWMVDQCDMVICYINASFGGAYTACKRAKKASKYMVNLGNANII